MSDLAGVQHGEGMTVSRLIKRLRFQECAGNAVSLALLRPIGLRKPALIRVPLAAGREARKRFLDLRPISWHANRFCEHLSMSEDRLGTRLSTSFSAAMATAIDDFRVAEGLSSQADAIRLLIEIGLDTVSNRGRRFWDKNPGKDAGG